MTTAATLFFLVACSPPEVLDDTGGKAGDDTSADSGTDTSADSGTDTGADSGTDTGTDSGTDTGAFPAEELADALEALLAFSMQVSAPSVLEPYQARMAGASDTCPTFYESDSGRYWSDACTAESGARFEGGGALIEETSADAGTTSVTTALVADAVMRSPEGAALTLDGQVTALRTDADDGSYQSHLSLVLGTFTLEGAEASWLLTELQVDLLVQGRYAPPTDGRAAYLDGGLFDMDGAYPEVFFEGLLIADAASGGACPTEPGGVIAVKDARTGEWWDITFDGETALGGGVEDPARCDGCGEVRLYGELLGEVCLDFSALTDWGEAPW